MFDMHPVTEECLEKMTEALKRFGTYSYDDKGPNEVMDIPNLVAQIRALPVEEAGEVLLEIANSPTKKLRGAPLASAILMDLQDWDELFEIPEVADLL
jgi:hypothetical protein